ncbi:hypothetical protein [Fluviispira vulneris]|uniref:hypothetical protein n=1 Tax=Fluviispira vulneris TaxID=2763012 RepID=UPI001645517E|nr:hypothetical protein [Fluviispira vulneris]
MLLKKVLATHFLVFSLSAYATNEDKVNESLMLGPNDNTQHLTDNFPLATNSQEGFIESDKEHFKYNENPEYIIVANPYFSSYEYKPGSIEIELVVPTYYETSFEKNIFSIPKYIVFHLNEALTNEFQRLGISFNDFTSLELNSPNPEVPKNYSGISIKSTESTLEMRIENVESAEMIAGHLLRQGKVLDRKKNLKDKLASKLPKKKFDDSLYAKFINENKFVLNIKLISSLAKYRKCKNGEEPKYLSIRLPETNS